MKQIRLSLGSAVVLGLRRARMDAQPTTLYALLGEQCLGACRFCAQARDSTADSRFLSRIVWPAFDLDEVVDQLQAGHPFQRFCLQTLREQDAMPELIDIVQTLQQAGDVPVSVCMNPVASGWLAKLKAAGVDRVGVGLDCATETTFGTMKPGFHWDHYHRFLDEIVEVFGTGSVHLIVGLGDTDEEIVRKMQEARDHNCYVALFAYTPVRGTTLDLPAPKIGRYRALQLARYLIISGRARIEDLHFEQGRLTQIDAAQPAIEQALQTGVPFRTSGCPDCNRPLYNERPGGAMYNYPAALSDEEKHLAREELTSYLVIRQP